MDAMLCDFTTLYLSTRSDVPQVSISATSPHVEEDPGNYCVGTDCKVVVNSCEVYAHKFLLQARSRFFSLAFSHDMQERGSGTVELKHVSASIQTPALHVLLRYLYTAQIKDEELQGAIAWDVLELIGPNDDGDGGFFGLSDHMTLVAACERALKCPMKSIDDLISFVSRAHCVRNGGLMKTAIEAATYFLPVLLSQEPCLSMLQNNPKLQLELLNSASKCIHASPSRPAVIEPVFLEPWVLAGSSRHSRAGSMQHTFEALTNANMFTGAVTASEVSPWFSATFKDDVVVERVDVGIGLTGYACGLSAEIQFCSGDVWHTFATVSGENCRVNKIRTDGLVVAREWRVIRRNANSQLGLSYLRFCGWRLHASSA